MNRLKFLLTDSRWSWFLRGLPSLARARSLYLARDATMTNFTRCSALWDICERVIRQNIPGAFVECGVWRGGSVGIMGCAAKAMSSLRPLHLFDSFEGLPEPGQEDGSYAVEYSGGKAQGRLASIAKCDAPIDVVRNHLLERLGLDPKHVHFHVGWFQNTVPADARSIGPIAILRLDGDWYASTQICLEHLYPLLSPGGVLILDDYNYWEGCRKATDEYREQNKVSAPLITIDGDASYWVKA